MTVSKKFKIGDKVIATCDTPTVTEGWIGFVVGTTPFNDYEVFAEGITGAEAFFESELELLSVDNKVTIRQEGALHNVAVKGTLDDEQTTGSALDKQVSGNHYKDCKIQPVEYIQANSLSYLEGNVIKYTTRHSKKNGKADILKAIHYLELILEFDYKDDV